jgi:multidrug efflux pump subunit AcrB
MDYLLNRAQGVVKSTAKQQQAYEKALVAVKQAKGMGDASGVPANLTKQANQELDKLERAAKDLDMSIKDLPAYQTYNQAMDFISQIQDNIDSIKAIAKQLV